MWMSRKDELRLGHRDQVDGVDTVCGFRDDRNVSVLAEEAREFSPRRRFVVGDHDGQHGRLTTASVPPPSRARISKFARDP